MSKYFRDQEQGKESLSRGITDQKGDVEALRKRRETASGVRKKKTDQRGKKGPGANQGQNGGQERFLCHLNYLSEGAMSKGRENNRGGELRKDAQGWR